MALTAQISRGVLTVSGAAARTVGQVEIDWQWSPFSVTDNAILGVEVPVSTDGSLVKSIDARGLTNAGAEIYASAATIFGSAQNDTIWTFGSKAVVNAGAGNNTIIGVGLQYQFGGQPPAPAPTRRIRSRRLRPSATHSSVNRSRFQYSPMLVLPPCS